MQAVAANNANGMFTSGPAGATLVNSTTGAAIESLTLPKDRVFVAVEVTPNGDMLLLDKAHCNVARMSNGVFEPIAFGSPGNRLTQFTQPTDIASNGERIAIADTGNRRVLLLDMAGANMGLFSEVNGAALGLPTSIAMSDDGTLFIGDEATHKVHAINADGSHRWTIGGWGKAPGRFAEPSGLDERDGMLLVADRLNHRIQAIDAMTGNSVDWWGMHALKPREGNGRIHYPEDVAFTSNGCVVAEPFEQRIQGFTLGEPDRALAPTQPTGSQSHFGPRIGLHGRTLVVFEPDIRAFHLFDIDRETPVHLSTFGSANDGPGCVQHPVNYVFEDTDAGLLLSVTDAADGDMHTWRLDLPPTNRPRFDIDMAKLLRTTPAVSPTAIMPPFKRSSNLPDGRRVALNDQDELLVGEGDQQLTIGGRGTNHGQLWNPSEVAVDHNGRMLVLDHGNHRMQFFNDRGAWLMTFGTGRAYTPKNTPSMRQDPHTP
jgi:hypothetical protein